jgi:hypothetical protein
VTRVAATASSPSFECARGIRPGSRVMGHDGSKPIVLSGGATGGGGGGGYFHPLTLKTSGSSDGAVGGLSFRR